MQSSSSSSWVLVLAIAGTTCCSSTRAAAGNPTCTNVMPRVGLHAHNDLAEKTVSTPDACCSFCSSTPNCFAWTLSGGACRAKGAKALHSSARVACSDCVSGFLSTPPRPPPPPGPLPPRPPGQKNVLLVVVDDLRPQLGAYYQNQTLTPNINAFAADALVFDRAFCQLAVCSPSRNSFMSGRRPDTTKTWNFKVSTCLLPCVRVRVCTRVMCCVGAQAHRSVITNQAVFIQCMLHPAMMLAC